jgi:hypothetical protein
MGGIEFPACTDDASPAFVTNALREGGVLGADSAVVEVEHEPIGVGVGIVGQLARLTLRYEGPAVGAPGTVILKMPSQYPENRRVGDFFNFYEREGRFYQQIAEKLDVRTPRCLWNHIDVESQTFALLLEDLSSRTMISQVTGVSATRAGTALACLAALHAAWWNSPALDGFEWMPRLDDPINLAAGQQYRDAWPVFVERIERAMPVEGLALGEKIQDAMEELFRRSIAEAPVTICHGDFRIDNLLFDDSTDGRDRVAVVDWQISFRGPAITDAAYLLCQSMTVEDRRAHEQALIEQWYEALVRDANGNLVDYPFDLAWEQYRRATLTMTVYPVTALGAMDPANERGLELCVQMALRSFTAALDLDAEQFLP